MASIGQAYKWKFSSVCVSLLSCPWICIVKSLGEGGGGGFRRGVGGWGDLKEIHEGCVK